MSEKNSKFKDILLPIIVLVSICAIITALMATVNLITEPRIAEAQAKKEADALREVLPEAEGFTKVELSNPPESVVALYSDNGSAALAVMLSVKGYDSSKPMSVAVGFDENGKITKCIVISANGETKGIGSKIEDESFLSGFYGKSDVSDVDAISGATISSSAFKAAIADAITVAEGFRATEVTK